MVTVPAQLFEAFYIWLIWVIDELSLITFTIVFIFTSTLLSRPNKVGLKCPSVRPQNVSLTSM